MEGCRSRGRPRLTYHDQIDHVLAEVDVMKRVMKVSEVCKDRVVWRSVLSAYPARDLA